MDDILRLSNVLKSSGTYKQYVEAVTKLHQIFTKFSGRQTISNASISAIVESVKALLGKDVDSSVALILDSEIDGYEMAKSTINITILSGVIAQAMKLGQDEFDDVLVAAVLHDIGMLRVNDKITQKNSGLTEMEMQTVIAHTKYGFTTAVSELMYTDRVGKIIKQHHENYDGSGYPGRLHGEQIELGARIIRVADAFVAMITPKTYRAAMLGYEVIKTLLKDCEKLFDPAVIKALIQSIGIFPVGSLVLLNNASVGRIVKACKTMPLRPDIRVIIDEEETQYPDDSGELVHLTDERNLFILEAIDPRITREHG